MRTIRPADAEATGFAARLTVCVLALRRLVLSLSLFLPGAPPHHPSAQQHLACVCTYYTYIPCTKLSSLSLFLAGTCIGIAQAKENAYKGDQGNARAVCRHLFVHW